MPLDSQQHPKGYGRAPYQPLKTHSCAAALMYEYSGHSDLISICTRFDSFILYPRTHCVGILFIHINKSIKDTEFKTCATVLCTPYNVSVTKQHETRLRS